MDITRRRFGALACGAFTGVTLADGCHLEGQPSAPHDGRLTARPRPNVPPTPTGPARTLGLERGRDGILQLPPKASGPVPLFVVLHGASGSGEGMLRRVGAAASDAG